VRKATGVSSSTGQDLSMNNLTFAPRPTQPVPTVNLSMNFEEVKVTYHDGHEEEIDVYGIHWTI
jgi:hypothetical protein